MLEKCIARARNAEIYSWEDNLVLKLFYSFIPRESVESEYLKTRLIRDKTPICPDVYDRISLEEGEGIVFENIEGKSITYNLLNNPLRLREYATIMAQTHKSIHKITVDGLPELNIEIGSIIDKSSRLDDYQKIKLKKLLINLPNDNKLCHMNFHPDSIFIGKKGPKVIDWMNASLGNPLLDVARTVVLLRFSSLPFQNILFRGVLKLSREILIKEYLDSYFQEKKHEENDFNSCVLLAAAARTCEKLPQSEIEKLQTFLQEEL